MHERFVYKRQELHMLCGTRCCYVSKQTQVQATIGGENSVNSARKIKDKLIKDTFTQKDDSSIAFYT